MAERLSDIPALGRFVAPNQHYDSFHRVVTEIQAVTWSCIDPHLPDPVSDPAAVADMVTYLDSFQATRNRRLAFRVTQVL